MEKKIKEIIRQVGDIAEKTSRLMDEGSPHSIDIDIILQDIRMLYKEVKDLQVEVPIDTSPRPKKLVPQDIQETGLSEEVAGDQDIVTEVQEKVTEPEEIVTETDEKAAEPEEVVTEIREEESISEDKPSEKSEKAEQTTKAKPTTLGDKFKGEKKFINESLANAGKKQDVGSKIQSKPIHNIGSALGINDRFKLINDLFKGDKETFQNAIAVLDEAPNFNEAFNYINSSFDWDMEDDSVQILLELVRRKFIVNENE